jgi:NAD(P)-dependent dehydrogenase (short-subunit alcohol dehydrogenase family)
MAVEAISDTARIELAPLGVSVSLVEPGMVRTAIHGKALVQHAQHPLSAEAKALYPALDYSVEELKAVYDAVQDTVDITSAAILHAVTSPQPHTRYIVGHVGGAPISILQTLLHILPDRLLDMMKAAF